MKWTDLLRLTIVSESHKANVDTEGWLCVFVGLLSRLG